MYSNTSGNASVNAAAAATVRRVHTLTQLYKVHIEAFPIGNGNLVIAEFDKSRKHEWDQFKDKRIFS